MKIHIEPMGPEDGNPCVVELTRVPCKDEVIDLSEPDMPLVSVRWMMVVSVRHTPLADTCATVCASKIYFNCGRSMTFRSGGTYPFTGDIKLVTKVGSDG